MGTEKIENQQPRMDVTKSRWSVHAHRIQYWPLLIQNSCSSRVASSRRCSCHVTCSHRDTFYRTTESEKNNQFNFQSFLHRRVSSKWTTNGWMAKQFTVATQRRRCDITLIYTCFFQNRKYYYNPFVVKHMAFNCALIQNHSIISMWNIGRVSIAAR